ncbi:[histone H3]-lysine(4) N-trimethyltransferase [Malassezia yamatoensis]|uniref:Histone-lysine N-methyltransferase, H3 lysine-36 specific n=1 Tax=Malassezia yamatoensis TaxID=253288 RepID=A0AAJ6CH81_9BASI|nr:[histone H3]-lysine(4) N-trimethyltransferase [Malassezia yamatoensis]
MPQLVDDLPVVTEAALSTFEVLGECQYQTSRMGRTRGQDDPTCECTPRHGEPYACTDLSGCINRLTQVECLRGVCQCGKRCQNQRFQKCDYAQVDIVQTPKKGYGLRARQDLAADAFVYEYLGEVINHATFLRRMQQYKDEHIAHFYFMMLQRDEYIDATKRGAPSRFINHSCNPNCYVSKWHVGKHVRMGIFAKRDIAAGEELTFNYNVDRYGNDAQECYCGEPNCVGSLGGRIQTDVVTMSDLYINALGIGEEVAQLRATLPRGKRSKILDEDFHPTLHAMKEEESARVITAVRQATSSRHILEKLLQRIVMTDDISVHKACVKLHGFVIMAGVLDEWADDAEIVTLALQCLAKWPLLARDKVVDAGVDAQVRRFAESDGASQNLAQSLLEAWDQLETTFRIARRLQTDEAQNATDGRNEDSNENESWAARRRAEAEAALRASMTEHAPSTVSKDLKALLGYRQADESVPKNIAKPAATRVQSKVDQPALAPSESIDDIIRKAYEANEAEQLKAAQQAEEAAKAAQEALQKQEARAAKRMEKANSKEDGSKRPPISSENGSGKEKRARSEKQRTDRRQEPTTTATPTVDLRSAERQLAKQVGALVVKQLSKVKQDLDTPRFKRHAKQLTHLLCDKERKNPKTWPPISDTVELSDEKRKKMKLFAHDYIKKLVQHQHAKQTRDMSESFNGDASWSYGNDTPNADMSTDLSFAVDGPILTSEQGSLRTDPDSSTTDILQGQSKTSPADSSPEDSHMEEASSHK